MTSTQFRKVSTKKRLSKEDEERISKGLEPIESEDNAQIRLVKYLEMMIQETGRIVKFTAIPNSTRTPYDSVRKKNIAMGLRKGLCDLLIIYRVPTEPIKRLLFLEMKREKGGTRKPEQKEWVKILQACEGTEAAFANGFDEAKGIIDSLIF